MAGPGRVDPAVMEDGPSWPVAMPPAPGPERPGSGRRTVRSPRSTWAGTGSEAVPVAGALGRGLSGRFRLADHVGRGEPLLEIEGTVGTGGVNRPVGVGAARIARDAADRQRECSLVGFDNPARRLGRVWHIEGCPVRDRRSTRHELDGGESRPARPGRQSRPRAAHFAGRSRRSGSGQDRRCVGGRQRERRGLPDLEPAPNGGCGFGTPRPQGGSGDGNGGTGRGGSSTRPGGSSPGGGLGGPASSLANRSGQSGGAGMGGSDANDPGASPYAGRSGPTERGGNPGSGSTGDRGGTGRPGGVRRGRKRPVA